MTLAIAASATIGVSALVVWSWWNSRSSRARLRAQLIESWGVPSADEIGPTEMHAIADYSLRHESGEAPPPRLDDTTWSDLEMDRVFQRANVASSTPGEEVLYDLFRRPAVTMEDWAFRHALVSAMEADPSVRVEAQVALRHLGKQRHVDTAE